MASTRDRRVFALLAASVVAMPLSFAVHAVTERAVIVQRMDPFVQAQRAGLSQALVLIGGRVGSSRSIAPEDLTRNGIDYSGPVLFGLDLGEDQHCRADRLVAGRRPHLYVWDHVRHYGLLSPLDCGAEAASARATGR